MVSGALPCLSRLWLKLWREQGSGRKRSMTYAFTYMRDFLFLLLLLLLLLILLSNAGEGVDGWTEKEESVKA